MNSYQTGLTVSAARYKAIGLVSLLMLIAALTAGLTFGSVRIPLFQTLKVLSGGPEFQVENEVSEPDSGNTMLVADRAAHTIIWSLRLPRVLLAALTGAALGVAGAAFQGLFRNSLADPYIIGSSSGAALGAAVAIITGVSTGILGFPAIPAFAFIGSIITVVIVYGISGASSSGRSAITLLLAGTALSSMISAVVSFLVVMNDSSLHNIYFWLLGGFSGRTWADIYRVLPSIVLGSTVLLLSANAIDVMAFGEDSAQSLGLNIGRFRLVVTGAASLCVASSVAAGGIIGFIGLVAPHIARMLFGAEHIRVIPGSAVIGALLLVLADLAARTVAVPIELPVGIFTALLGAPFFLYLLRTRSGDLGRRKL